AWEAKAKESEFWDNAGTCAFGITVPKAIGDFLVLEAVYETNGCAIAITDEDTLAAENLLASVEGAFVCPEGAATLAATQKLFADGWIQSDERVVLLNTGCGIKYPETVQCDPPLLQPGETLPANG
ncbi:pyridoxal-phosphate dependent enzyme, partial [bacterium]|nr:pyridoxal-phosphate dependent enzyme [bacterium]